MQAPSQSASSPVRASQGVWINRDVAIRLGLASVQEAATLVHTLISTKVAIDKVLKDDPLRSVVELKVHAQRHWVVKRYWIDGVRPLLAGALRLSPAWREWRGAAALERIGCRCNPPLALAASGASGRRAQILVLPYVHGRPISELLEYPDEAWSPARRSALARRVGRQIGGLLAHKVVNRDHKVSNLIVDAACARGEAEPVVIDPVGIVRLRGARQVERLLAMMARTTLRAGPFASAEAVALIRGIAEVAPSVYGLPMLASYVRRIGRR